MNGWDRSSVRRIVYDLYGIVSRARDAGTTFSFWSCVALLGTLGIVSAGRAGIVAIKRKVDWHLVATASYSGSGGCRVVAPTATMASLSVRFQH